MAEGIGTVNLWGNTPARNFHELLAAQGLSDKKTLHIHVVGAGDARHVLKTMSRHFQAQVQTNFLVVEQSMAVLARQLFQLHLAFEPLAAVGLQDKAAYFLELLGNTLVRAKTLDYLKATATTLIKLITDPERAARELPWADLAPLKYKERDELEAVFKMWRSGGVDLARAWDDRLRAFYKQRYDARAGVSDWDYSMHLLPLAPNVNQREFIAWRTTGIAFRPHPDAPYDTPNSSLVTLRAAPGARGPVAGFWGDIVTGPLVCFGIECEDASMLEKRNHAYVKTAGDVSERNVLAMLYELAAAKPFPHASDDMLKGLSLDTLPPTPAAAAGRVSFCTAASYTAHTRKESTKGSVDLLYLSNSMVHLLTPELVAVLAPAGLVCVETTVFFLDLKREIHSEFLTKVNGMAAAAGLVPLAAPAPTDAYLRFARRAETADGPHE